MDSFKEHQNIIWGSVCSCGHHVSILQNVHHPWDDDDFTVIMKCDNCQILLEINREKAATFYNEKIYSYFDEVEGTVLDLGCGSGFLSKWLAKAPSVRRIIGLDLDEESATCFEEESIEFILSDLSNLTQYFEKGALDYLVSRDVFMFIEDPEQYFNDVTDVVKKEIKQMGSPHGLTPPSVGNRVVY